MANFEKHVGKGKTIEIDGEEYHLLPLTISELPQFFKLMKAFKDIKVDSTLEESLESFDEETGELISNLIKKTLEKSYPDIDKELRERFGLKYMGVLLNVVVEINMDTAVASKDKKMDKFIAQQKKTVNNESDTTTKK